MKKLPTVTLIAYGSHHYAEAQQKALDLSCKGIKWGAVKNIIDDNCTDIGIWNQRIISELPKHVDTSHCLLIHHNGFVVNPKAWTNRWLKLDFIGSPWPLPNDNFSYRTPSGRLIRVGNSVSLRSKKLLDLVAQREMKYHYGNNNEDGEICVWQRDWLESKGSKFATFEQAIYFGRETSLPENKGIKPFVFHNYAGENAIYANRK